MKKNIVNRSFGIDTRIFAARIQRQWVVLTMYAAGWAEGECRAVSSEEAVGGVRSGQGVGEPPLPVYNHIIL